MAFTLRYEFVPNFGVVRRSEPHGPVVFAKATTKTMAPLIPTDVDFDSSAVPPRHAGEGWYPRIFRDKSKT
jgi:hypothetical protein